MSCIKGVDDVLNHGSLDPSQQPSQILTQSPLTLLPQQIANANARSTSKKKSKISRPPTPPRVSSRHALNIVPDSPKLSSARTLKRKPKRSSLRLVSSPPGSLKLVTTMASPIKTSPPTALDRTENRFGQHEGGGSLATSSSGLPMPGLSGRANSPTGNLLKGPIDEDGKLKNAALLVGIKLDLEAEVHLTARVRGDVVVGLY
ncbi:hypothetical protein F5Y14DRAFT_416452 [Nemania sp. NC0429]|nr:hypothetical protein F5Y14DRAFT_416452 [Nemania sp. NC0429]